MKKALLVLLPIMAFSLFSIAEANLLSNGSFETASVSPGGFVTLSPPSTAIDGWTVLSGSIDYIGSYWAAQDGGRSIDLNGNETGAIYTYFATTPGAQYQVDFYMAGNPDGLPGVKSVDLRMYYNGLNFFIDHQAFSFDATNTSKTNMGWEIKTFFFTAPANNATLLFGSLIGGYYGPALDNVVVTQVAGVPEPTALILLSSAILGVAVLKRRGSK